MKYHVKLNEKDFLLEIVESEKSLAVQFNSKSIQLENYRQSGGALSMILQDNHPYEMQISNGNNQFDCWLDSRLTQCSVISEKEARYAKLMGAKLGEGKSDFLKAPMPGLVVKILVEAGQAVKKGDGLLIVEAMKMENELKASSDGKVKEVKVAEKEAVDKNQVLLEFE